MKCNLDNLHSSDVSFPEKYGASLLLAFLITSASDKMPFSTDLDVKAGRRRLLPLAFHVHYEDWRAPPHPAAAAGDIRGRRTLS